MFLLLGRVFQQTKAGFCHLNCQPGWSSWFPNQGRGNMPRRPVVLHLEMKSGRNQNWKCLDQTPGSPERGNQDWNRQESTMSEGFTESAPLGKPSPLYLEIAHQHSSPRQLCLLPPALAAALSDSVSAEEPVWGVVSYSSCKLSSSRKTRVSAHCVTAAAPHPPRHSHARMCWDESVSSPGADVPAVSYKPKPPPRCLPCRTRDRWGGNPAQLCSYFPATQPATPCAAELLRQGLLPLL